MQYALIFYDLQLILAPMGLAVEGANRNDFKMVEATLTTIPIERPTPTPTEPQEMCVDKGDDDDD